MKIFIFLLFLVFYPNTVVTQISFKTINVESGLSQNSVVSIAQDSIGYLWFATQDGLNRYHGEYTIFNQQFKDVTRDDYCHLGKVYVDLKGEIWIVTADGLLKKYSETSNSFIVQPKFKDVNLIFQDNDYYYWTTTTSGLILRSDFEFSVSDTVFHNSDYNFFDIQQVNQSNVSVTSSKCVLSFDISNETAIQSEDVLKDISVSSISSKFGKTYFATFSNGIYYKFGDDKIKKVENCIFDNICFYKVIVDSKSRVWLGSYGSGVFVINEDGSVNQYLPDPTHNNGLSYHDVLDIYEDDSGVIWIGTDGGGINYYDENLKKFHSKTKDSVPLNINIDVIRSIYVEDEIVYLGSSGMGLTVYNKSVDSWKTITTEDGLASNRIMAIQKAINGKLLVGNQNSGLSIIDLNSKFQIKGVDNYLDDNTVWCIEKNDDNTFWIGTLNAGIFLFDTEQGVIIHKEIFNNRGEVVSVRVIKKYGSNSLLIGTDKDGIFLYDSEDNTIKALVFQTYDFKKIKDIYIDKDTIYIATNGSGLFVADATTFEIISHCDINSGLPNNVIYGVYKGINDDIWMSSNRGITSFKILNDSNFQIRNYIKDEGLQSYEYNTGAHFRTPKNEIYFGGINGFNWFDPSEIVYNRIPPRPFIHDIKVMNISRGKFSNHFELKPFESIFSIHLASNQLSVPNRNVFKYRLKGFQNDWQITNEPDVLFMNIDPGDYTFEFAVSNYDGVWSEIVDKRTIHVLQVWYLTWWFKLLVFCLFSYLLYRIWYSDRIRIELQHKTKQQKLKQEYLESLNETRSNFFANITHELLTPLTVINGLSSRIEGNAKIKSTIANNCRSLIDLVNQVLSISKLKSGYLVHDPYLLDIVSFVNYLTDSFSSLANEKYISLSFYSDVSVLIMDFDPPKLRTVLSNLIVNAIKYTPQYGKVMVTAKQINSKLVISIIDNGIGMDDDTLSNMFNRFYQAGLSKQGGVGIGLSIVKEYCDVMDVDLHIESDINKGTCFQLNLSITQEAKKIQNEVVQNKATEHVKIGRSVANCIERNILLVEDNVDVANYIMQVLSEHYCCVHYKNGKEAFNYAIEHIPDLIITDIMMPVMNGIRFSKNIRSDIRTSHIPIIMLTAKVSEGDKLVGLKSGINAYVTKPFNEDELLIRIENLFESRQALQNEFNRTNKAIARVIPTVEDTFLKKVRQTIEENIGNENLSINDICLAVNLERTQVYRKLKALSGKSASEIIKDIRLEKAYDMLQSGNQQISEVAFYVGYKEVSYFSKSFKSKYGYSPSNMKNKSEESSN